MSVYLLSFPSNLESRRRLALRHRTRRRGCTSGSGPLRRPVQSLEVWTGEATPRVCLPRTLGPPHRNPGPDLLPSTSPPLPTLGPTPHRTLSSLYPTLLMFSLLPPFCRRVSDPTGSKRGPTVESNSGRLTWVWISVESPEDGRGGR